MVHPVAASGFGAEADAYERARPTYPPEAVAWLVEGLAPDAPRPDGAATRVVDLAAGTGKLTRLLRDFLAAADPAGPPVPPAGANAPTLLAVEPVAGMRDHLRREVLEAMVVAGVAEALPLSDRSVDLVTVAQAFHWFDAPTALAEIRRVLRPGGRLALVWNARDRSVDWLDRVWSVMDRVERRAPWRDHEQAATDPHAWRAETLGAADGFGPVEQATFHHEQILDPEGVVDRVRGVSHVAALPEREQAAVLAEVREIVALHPATRGRDRLAIPYRVDAYRLERAP